MEIKTQNKFIDLVKNTISNNGQTIGKRLEEKHKGFESGWKVDGNEVVFWVSPTLSLSDYTGSLMNEFSFTIAFDEETDKFIVSGNSAKSRTLL
ncbi:MULTISPECIES: hypothetical protein [unclassified Lysinibacillus]|uniref:hypothetical protein n=1 Tax=unclassified Lysinibacillus TaxID=2636778 RepID=UPI00232C36EC|nr:hypothetical protein [Lysinibacillus sp. OF-1]WCH45877.1 hypothetical protein NV349_12255 [Lysinibacillus sp. OF-1]